MSVHEPNTGQFSPVERVKWVAASIGRSCDDELAEYILWEHTGFPSFWAIPEDGATPEACLEKQVLEFFHSERTEPT